MRALVVLSLELGSPDDITAVLAAINPPAVPCFAGELRVVVEPEASAIERWLDE